MDDSGEGRVEFGRAFGGPGKYVQRAGEIDRLADHPGPLGAKAFLPADIEHVAKAALAPRSATWRSAAPLSVATERDAILALDAFTSTLAPRP